MKFRKMTAAVLACLTLAGCGTAEQEIAENNVSTSVLCVDPFDCDPVTTTDPESPQDSSHIELILGKEDFPADTTVFEIKVKNNGDTSFSFRPDSFSLRSETEHWTVTQPRNCCMPQSGYVHAGDAASWSVYLWEVGLTALEPGDYALCLGEQETAFTILSE